MGHFERSWLHERGIIKGFYIPHRKRDCYSDEHYVPVLLAYLGLDNETTCNGNTMHVSWQSSSGTLTTTPLTFLHQH